MKVSKAMFQWMRKSKKKEWYLRKQKQHQKLVFADYHEHLAQKGQLISGEQLKNQFALYLAEQNQSQQFLTFFNSLQQAFFAKHALSFDAFTIVWTRDDRFSFFDLVLDLSMQQPNNCTVFSSKTPATNHPLHAILKKFNLFIQKLLVEQKKFLTLFPETLLMYNEQAQSYQIFFSENLFSFQEDDELATEQNTNAQTKATEPTTKNE